MKSNRPSSRIPNFTFPMVAFGVHEIPWDLKVFLYLGGAHANSREVGRLIEAGELGKPLMDRVAIIERVHEYILANLTRGGSRGSADTSIRRIKEFFSWVDDYFPNICLRNLAEGYLMWTEYLIYKSSRIHSISELHAYQCAVAVAKVIDSALDLQTSLLRKSRLRRPRGRWDRLCSAKEREDINLEDIFRYGRALVDLVGTLTDEVIFGKLPIRVTLRTGETYENWLKLWGPAEELRTLRADRKPSIILSTLQKRRAYEADTSREARAPIFNLRIGAELSIFIAQTGINLQQAHVLPVGKFKFRAAGEDFEVYRTYKDRRHGDVEFQIFREYREIFERYLKWRDCNFPEDGRLFPFITKGRAAHNVVAFENLKDFCSKVGVKYFASRVLRKARINWILRESKDPRLTARMHGHAEGTLNESYVIPSRQIALVEICRYHNSAESLAECPGPGGCAQSAPEKMPGTPIGASEPDCTNAAGCLFCNQQRDIDSEEHVWSLVSYRYLKALEFRSYRNPRRDSAVHPAHLAIERLSLKIGQIAASSVKRADWVREALARVDEEDFHPKWDGFIQLMEGAS
ncbi:hypothetical protein CupriaWKF_03005 [Cupriavidus sp. WKF15]|uniref:hypothetical protein n=1 Tax=Cupriavidus sp. WKF15 TaxID=3032282 RepID=UPI0023E1B4DC|nr:hypothetical protein [Cupriavidus sp. WKF15]WER46573.1 hypothetical protein CupriaWKF_03005 [Cupriavidus sp. WKF15]